MSRKRSLLYEQVNQEHCSLSNEMLELLDSIKTENDVIDPLLRLVDRAQVFEFVKQLIKKFPNLVHTFLDNGQYKGTILHVLVRLEPPNLLLIEEVLRELYKDEVSAYDSNGDTPLHFVCVQSQPDPALIMLLIQYGADVSLFDADLKTVLDHQYSSEQTRDILLDADNEQRYWRYHQTMPTLSELKQRYGDGKLADYMLAAQQAMRFVHRTNVQRAPNDQKGNQHTSGLSSKVFASMNERLSKMHFRPGSQRDYNIALQKAALLGEFRGGGDCFYQSSLAYFFLLVRGYPVEYYRMEGGSHHFVVIGRDVGSDMEEPATWGEHAVVCDPWLERSYPASHFMKPKEYAVIQKGTPYRLFRTPKSQPEDSEFPGRPRHMLF